MNPATKIELLDLPVELRLRIYYYVVFEPWPVSIPQTLGIGMPPRLVNTRSISEVDRRLAADTTSLYWSSNTFSLPIGGEQFDKSADDDFYKWLETKAAHEVRSIRHLEFVIKMRCPDRGQMHVGTRIRAAPTCTTRVSVHLARLGEDAIEIRDDEGCSHRRDIVPRFRDALSMIARRKLAPELDRATLWDLKECAYYPKLYPYRRKYYSAWRPQPPTTQQHDIS